MRGHSDHQLTRLHLTGALIKYTFIPILQFLFFYFILFPDMALQLHTLSIVFFCAARLINHYPSIALVDRLSVRFSYPVRRAWPTVWPVAGRSPLGGIPEEGALFHSFVNHGHPGVLLVRSSLPSVWCGDPRAWPLKCVLSSIFNQVSVVFGYLVSEIRIRHSPC